MSLPKPYYEDSAVTIYCADNRDISLSDFKRFDLLLTDPPYGIGRDGKPPSTSSHGGHKGYEFSGWDSETPSASEFNRMLMSAKDYVIWGGNYFTRFLPPSSGWLVWDKAQRIDQADAELAASSRYGPVRIFDINRVAIALDGAVHPTQKPLVLMAWCLSFFPEAQTVFDPFAGSGTTGRACKDLGRKCVMIEREERYCEIAARRMGQEVLNLQ